MKFENLGEKWKFGKERRILGKNVEIWKLCEYLELWKKSKFGEKKFGNLKIFWKFEKKLETWKKFGNLENIWKQFGNLENF